MNDRLNLNIKQRSPLTKSKNYLIKSDFTVKEAIVAMKRNMNLIRELLLQLEESQGEIQVSNLQVAGYSDKEIAYNAYMMIEGGLAQGSTINLMEDGRPVAVILTNLISAGHDFFDSIKNDTVWNNTLNYLKEKGGNIPFTLIPPIAALFAKQYFRLP